VGNAAILALADMLKENTTLIALRLNSNDQIGTEGAKAIASALQTNESLATVDLSQADITGEGAAHLAEALKGNRSVSSMLLNDTNLSHAALSCLGTACLSITLCLICQEQRDLTKCCSAI
jgi:Ran GTPase-activating protein (RanGAP) involved in mRNA processing and transport